MVKCKCKDVCNKFNWEEEKGRRQKQRRASREMIYEMGVRLGFGVCSWAGGGVAV